LQRHSGFFGFIYVQDQGCQILAGKTGPNEHKMYQMVIKYPKCA
jgi:hypothetical protein